MSEQDLPAQDERFDVTLPPNARLAGLVFDPAGTMKASFSDASERAVKPADIIALHGGRIRHEQVVSSPRKISGAQVFVAETVAGSTGKVTNIGGDLVATKENLHFALALRIAGAAELWYLLADSFNFRKALGPDAAYVTEFNLRALVKRLATFAPHATQDSFFAAIIGGMPLPPPVDSLFEFFRTVSKV
ncbi:MAG: hypothetical protein JO293_06535 [Candidatus Eremiobacteraeota bacterium]|nr:hypothetical protein [Candidatus Eremiobacteraeota bacterium]MBV8223001.1 hypothetical protein [Candidatus Eremiobacteraeota bacterium]MBV8280737.1 hypothetical protein [Candidatus Eremiobacteraeota bacterium]